MNKSGRIKFRTWLSMCRNKPLGLQEDEYQDTELRTTFRFLDPDREESVTIKDFAAFVSQGQVDPQIEIEDIMNEFLTFVEKRKASKKKPAMKKRPTLESVGDKDDQDDDDE